ncbi:MAG: prolipoprotein diacylglyceryl transferase [Halanaerobiaceae bacterium]|nr:prolipoprotein diacylglyceryl transferase [Halanaerobiaceae bacterium]
MIDPVAFRIGPLEIRWYAVIISTAFFLGAVFSIRDAKKMGIEEDFMLDLFIRVIPAAIIGARLYYVLFSWDHYKDNLLEILAFRSGGLAIHGGIIGGLLAAYCFIRKSEKSFARLADIIAPYIILGQAMGRWGNFINQEAYGGVVSKEFISKFPDFIEKQMYINGNYHHPAFLYESLWNFLIFIVLISLKQKKFLKEGDLFLIYLIGYSLGRFVIEGMRTDSLMLGSFRIAQIVSLILIAGCTVLIWQRHRKRAG